MGTKNKPKGWSRAPVNPPYLTLPNQPMPQSITEFNRDMYRHHDFLDWHGWTQLVGINLDPLRLGEPAGGPNA